MNDFAQKDQDLGGTIELVPEPDVRPPSFDVPGDLPPPAEGLAPPADDDAGFGAVVAAGWTDETIRTDAWNYSSRKRREIADQMFDLLPGNVKSRVWDRFADNTTGWTTFEEIVMSEAATIAQQTPETARLFSGFPLSRAGLDRRINDERRAELEAAQRILDQPGGAVAGFIGASARALTDEASLMTLPMGGGAGPAWKIIAREALAGAAGEALVLPREFRVAGELGIADPDPVSRIAMGAALGGGLTAGVLGIGKALSMWSGYRSGIRAIADGDDLEAEIRIDDAEATMRGDETVQQRVAPRMAPEPGTLPDIIGQSGPGGLPPVGPDAPENWAAIRNGIFAGESGGDYNALFGYQNRKGGVFSRVRLTEMTVDQAIAFSAPDGRYGQWVKGRIGRVATPMGAYQIVGKTLRAAKAALRLNGDELMTPDLQEQLGHWIYRSQGTGAWEGYKGPRAQFTPSAADADVPGFAPTSRGYTGAGQVSVGDGMRIDVDYEIVDASEIFRASGEYQPRDRSRIASDAWISDTAARLDPAQLMPSPTADRGAPIVGPDGMIESGNGRYGAIVRAYERHPDRAAQYRREIESAGFSVPEGMDRPVLVARRKTDLSHDDRVRLTVDAQDSGVAVMTPTEMARTSGRAMTPDVLGRLDPGQPIRAEGNADFVRSALSGLPRSARNAMFDDKGLLNSAGERQLREALFARAWPDPDILARYTEGNAGDLKSLLEALETAAPGWAALRADIEAGRVAPQMDIGGHVLDAMRLIAAARELAMGQKIPMARAISDLLEEVDLIEGAISPLTAALVRKFWRNGRAAPADEVAAFLTRYATEARKAGATGSMFDAPGPRDVLVTIDKAHFGDLPEDLGAARGYATPETAREPVAMPDRGYDEGAASPDAQAADGLMRADLEAEGPFGPVYRDIENDLDAAIARLMQEQTGEVPAAFVHPLFREPIAFIYGKADSVVPSGKTRSGFGLKHIEADHGREFIETLPDLLRNGTVYEDMKGLPKRYIVDDSDPSRVAVVRLNFDESSKNWVVTSFDDHVGDFSDRSQWEAFRVTGLGEERAPSPTGQPKDTPSAPDFQGDDAVPDLTRIRAEFDDLSIDMPDGTSWSARELLDDLDADDALDLAVETCAINPGGIAQ